MSVIDRFKLDGKVAIVTGAGRGLGRTMAIGLAEAGADIAGVDVIDMEDLCREVRSRGRRCEAISADLSTTQGLEELVQEVVGRLGSLDILVNNTGIIRRSPLTEFSKKDWDKVIDLNLRTVFFLSKAAARVFIEQGKGGKIVNIASMLSFQGGIREPSYTASKSGVTGLTRLLACELAEHNINVNAITPGYIATANTEPIRKDTEPKDLQWVVAFLASDTSSYMNGYTIAVDEFPGQ